MGFRFLTRVGLTYMFMEQKCVDHLLADISYLILAYELLNRL